MGNGDYFGRLLEVAGRIASREGADLEQLLGALRAEAGRFHSCGCVDTPHPDCATHGLDAEFRKQAMRERVPSLPDLPLPLVALLAALQGKDG